MLPKKKVGEKDAPSLSSGKEVYGKEIFMDFTGYDKKIRDLAEKIEVQYILFDEGIFHNLGLLLGLAEEISDTALLGYVYYQLADAYYSFHFDVDSMQKYLSLGIKVQQEEGDYSLLAKSYNLLGITEFLRGNFGLSFDYFMSSLEYCKEIEPVDNSLRGIINSNIARLYFTLNDYDHGRYYAEEALYDISGSAADGAYLSNMIGIYTFLGNIYLRRSGDVRAARACMESILEVSKNSPYRSELMGGLDVLIFSIRLSHYEGKMAERDLLIHRFSDKAVLSAIRANMVVDVCYLAEFFLEIGKIEESKRILELLRGRISEIHLPELEKRFVESEILYYEKTGEVEKRNETCYRYYLLVKEQDQEMVSAFLFALGIRKDLEDLKEQNAFMEEENVRLTKKAEYDELTGLPNRYHLRFYADAAFERAYNARTNFALEMVDVDYFKQYNDFYGHQKGDECLKLVAGEIKKLCQKNPAIYAARYGGDEFVLIYENMTDEEVLAYAKELGDSVKGLHLSRADGQGGEITISQGIRNSVPLKKNRVWDYTFSADTALYRVKGKERGGIRLIHKAKLEGEKMYV